MVSIIGVLHTMLTFDLTSSQFITVNFSRYTNSHANLIGLECEWVTNERVCRAKVEPMKTRTEAEVESGEWRLTPAAVAAAAVVGVDIIFSIKSHYVSDDSRILAISGIL